MISDREHTLEGQELINLRLQMRLPLRSFKRQPLPVRTQPRPATTVAVRLMSLGVRPNSSEGMFPLTYRGLKKTGDGRLCHSLVGSGGYPIRRIIWSSSKTQTLCGRATRCSRSYLVFPRLLQAISPRIEVPGHIVFGIAGHLKVRFKATLLVHTSKLYFGSTGSAASQGSERHKKNIRHGTSLLAAVIVLGQTEKKQREVRFPWL
jgi:hypothetical protein